MKSPLFLFVILLFALFSCQFSSQSSKQEISPAVGLSNSLSSSDTFPRATAILWIDLKSKKKSETIIYTRVVKAKVNIHLTGSVELLSYTKAPEGYLRKYIQEKMQNYKIKEAMLDSGFIKPGVQYVQLRYIPSKAPK